MRSVWLGLSLLVVFSACPDLPKPNIVDAAVADLDSGARGELVVDAGPPPPSSLEPKVIAGYPDGGAFELPLKAEIDAPTSLTISLPIKLKDFRIRLLDYREQLVISDDELTVDGLTYLINLPEPLKTGRGYTLTLDAELGPIVTDHSGGTWNDWELAFRIAGDIQPEVGTKKKKPKKKKR